MGGDDSAVAVRGERRGGREPEATTSALVPLRPAEAAGDRVPALTVLWHPDLGRIGGWAGLDPLAAGGEVSLSRLEPAFLDPGEKASRPLADLCLSRRPIFLRPLADGGLRVDPGGSPISLVLDGAAVEGTRDLSRQDIQRGVVLVLAGRVALLLHPAPDRPKSLPPSFGLVGESAAMVEARREIARVADTEVPVLLRGETGTGKDLVARAIHRASRRRSGPYLAVNMAAIPPSLAAAELFGAAKGAFTGAVQSQPGYFVRADGGVLFLDEIGATPAELQSLLLRAIENREIQPVGGSVPLRVDVRLIAATDSNLEAKVADGEFRAPLLHRLSGYEIALPALRQRREDLGLLLAHFLAQELSALGRGELLDPAGAGEPWLGAPLVARFAAFAWPGNVRQLRNVARQLAIANRDSPQVRLTPQVERMLREVAPPPEAAGARGRAYRRPSAVSEGELMAALRENRFELKATARSLGISRPSLYVLIERCRRVRKASDLDARDIERSLARSGGDLAAAALALEVSCEGLRQRMRALGLAAGRAG